MNVFCDRLKLGSTTAPDCLTSQNKGRYVSRKRAFFATLNNLALNAPGFNVQNFFLIPTIVHRFIRSPVRFMHHG